MSCDSTTRVSIETIVLTSNRAFVHRGAERFVRWILVVSGMLQRRGDRQALLELDDRLLDDIGLTREQAEQLARKPFWK